MVLVNFFHGFTIHQIAFTSDWGKNNLATSFPSFSLAYFSHMVQIRARLGRLRPLGDVFWGWIQIDVHHFNTRRRLGTERASLHEGMAMSTAQRQLLGMDNEEDHLNFVDEFLRMCEECNARAQLENREFFYSH